MSRIGKKPIPLPDGVKVGVRGMSVEVTGPLGKLDWCVPDGISVAVEEAQKLVRVDRGNDQRRSRALHGLSRALIANMIQGVSQGFKRRLLIFGTGYSCAVQDRTLRLNVGFMGRGGPDKAQFNVTIPDGLEVTIEVPAARGDTEPAKLLVSGCDKQSVGEFAADVRKLRPPEPYKGKGIRYEDEYVRRKQGKAVAGSG